MPLRSHFLSAKAEFLIFLRRYRRARFLGILFFSVRCPLRSAPRRSCTFSSPPPDICWVFTGGSPSISSSTGTHTIFASELLRRSQSTIAAVAVPRAVALRGKDLHQGLRTLPGDCNRCEPPPFSPAPRAPELFSSLFSASSQRSSRVLSPACCSRNSGGLCSRFFINQSGLYPR